ncbi:cationic peroxidase SPC4-like [Miscanthus floridulus]|uniref:cationic peroxidase SPC4-like n=1 Tax=Miscanthus floridulus TaxID=154761 RepID=UPI003457F0C4
MRAVDAFATRIQRRDSVARSPHSLRATSPYVLQTCLVLLRSLRLPRWRPSSSSSAPTTAEAGNTGNARQPPPLAPGLSFDFYKCSCPKAESIVRSFVQDAVRRDVGLAAGLLRLHFHDCFVQGCDASVLLDGSATGPGEQQAPPNLTLRPTAFKAINDIHDRLQKECGGAVVSCSDVLALAARDSVVVE